MAGKKLGAQNKENPHGSAVYGGAEFACRRALVLVRNPFEREAIRALLTSWGCDTQTAAAVREIDAGPAPDFAVVAAAEQTEAAGVAELSAVHARYARAVPAVVIGEPSATPAMPRFGGEYVVLEPMFAPARLREALTRLLHGERGRA